MPDSHAYMRALIAFAILTGAIPTILSGNEQEVSYERLRHQFIFNINQIKSADVEYQYHLNNITTKFEYTRSQRLLYDCEAQGFAALEPPEELEDHGTNEYFYKSVFYSFDPGQRQITISRYPWGSFPSSYLISNIINAGRTGVPGDQKECTISTVTLNGVPPCTVLSAPNSPPGFGDQLYIDEKLGGLLRKEILDMKQIHSIRTTDYLVFGTSDGITHSMEWTEKTVNKYAEVVFSYSIKSARYNIPIPAEKFVPRDFDLCWVMDNRFTPALMYSAKGQLPSDEEVVLFSQDPAALREHELEMQKLNR